MMILVLVIGLCFLMCGVFFLFIEVLFLFVLDSERKGMKVLLVLGCL